MRQLFTLLGFSCLALPSLAFPTYQGRLGARTLSTDEKLEAVKEAFSHGFNGYMEHAYPHDELKPVSNGHSNPLYDIPPVCLFALRIAGFY